MPGSGPGPFSFGASPTVKQPTTSPASRPLFGYTPTTSGNDIASPAQPITSASADATSGAPNGQVTAGSFGSMQKANPFIKLGPVVNSTVKDTSPSTMFKGFGSPSAGSVALKSTFSFGQSTPASPSSQSIFGFGQSTPASPMPQSAFGFGQSTSATRMPQSTFGFGQSTPASPMPQSTFGFGQSTPASPMPQSTFGYGQFTSASPAPQPTFAFAFGQSIPASPIAQSVSSSVQANPALSSPKIINTTTESGSESNAGNREASLSDPAIGLHVGANKCRRVEEATQAPEDLRLWHNKKHTDLTVTCGSATWQCHRAILLPRCPAFEEACVVRVSDGQYELKLDENKSEIVEGLLIYLYTYEFPKFATVGDASIATQLGDLYSVPRFARNAKLQILDSVKNFGQVGNEDIASWARNFELWWASQQTAMADIKTQALELIRKNAERFMWSAAFMDLLGRNKDLRIDVFKMFATYKTSEATEHAATDVVEHIKSSNDALRARLGEQFKSKVKELNGKIKEK